MPKRIVAIGLLIGLSVIAWLYTRGPAAKPAQISDLPSQPEAGMVAPANETLGVTDEKQATLTTSSGTTVVPLVAGRFVQMGDKYGLSNVATDFPFALKLAESGDQVAIRTLLSALATCDASSEEATRTDEEYVAKRTQIEAPDSVWAKDPAGRDQKLATIEKLHIWCRNVGEEHFGKRRDLLALGAKLGMPDAIAQFENGAKPTDTWRQGFAERLEQHYQQTREIYLDQISRGNRASLLHLALMEFDGRPGIARNPVDALAHLYALEQANGGIPENTVAYTRMQALNRELTPEQAAQAQRRAADIVERCCS